MEDINSEPIVPIIYLIIHRYDNAMTIMAGVTAALDRTNDAPARSREIRAAMLAEGLLKYSVSLGLTSRNTSHSPSPLYQEDASDKPLYQQADVLRVFVLALHVARQ